MEVHRLTSNGPAYAALLQEAALLRGPFDGLLLGTASVRTEAEMHDTREETRRDLLEVHISTFCCCSGLGSFYNAAGDIEAEEVASIAQAHEGRLLGWFTHQHGRPRQPSVRERAVTAAMAQFVAQEPVIFALMHSSLDQDRATAGFEQRFMQQEAGTVVLKPVEIRIENLGSLKRSRDYRPLRRVLGLSPAPDSLFQQRRDQARSEIAAAQADRLVANAAEQTRELERVFQGLMHSLGEEAGKVTKDDADLRALQYEVDALTVSLGL